MTGIDYTYFIKPHAARRQAGLARELTKLEYGAKNEIISFAEGLPNVSVFPFESMKVDLKDGSTFILERAQLDRALQYIPSQGYPPLVEFLKEFTRKMHQPPNWEQKELMVTNGAQEGMSKAIEMVLADEDPILIQNPLYLGTEAVLRPFNPEFLAIEQDEYGMRSDSLLQVLQNRSKGGKMPKMLYINPTGSNPTGCTIPDNRRKEIYGICCKYNILILEDDAYCFMNYTENPKSFLSMDTEGRVLRFDSFSKVVSAGLRVGWMTGPKEIVRNLELHVQSSCLHSSSLSQVVTERLLNTWGIETLLAHLESTRKFYKARCDVIIAAMERHLKNLCEWKVPAGGMFVWFKVLGVNDVYDMIMKRAIGKGITFVPGHAFVADPTKPCNYVRASFSRATPENIEKGIKLLADLIREEILLQNKSR